MYVRLAFAVAAHLEPEILIVDEVLAVGDGAFQKKCLRKMEDVAKSQGRTVLFVSHNMGAIARLCKRSILLEGGALAMMDSTEAVISRYVLSGQTQSEREWSENKPAPGNSKMRLRSVRVTDREGSSLGSVDIRRSFFIEIRYQVLEAMAHLRIGLRLLTSDGTVAFTSVDTSNRQWSDKTREVGEYASRCEIPGNFLNEGIYTASV
jgi:lipopolysaccharide transport system ATP-binding protein